MNKMSKKIVLAAAVGVAAFSMMVTGCSGGNKSAESSTASAEAAGESKAAADDASAAADTQGSAGAAAGGWALNDSFAPSLSGTQKEIFDKAAAAISEKSYEPVAVIGQQVVAGMNYAYLCSEKAADGTAGGWKVVVIYNDLDGNAEVTAINDLDVNAIKTVSAGGSAMTGAWGCPDIDPDVTSLPEAAYSAFTKAVPNIDSEITFEPIALLATQAAAGTNYKVLCKGTMYDGEPEDHIFVCDIYEDADKNASLTGYEMLDIVALVTAG